MKRFRLALVACMAVYAAMSAGIGQASTAVGACVLGNGLAVDAPEGDLFVGVNVGMSSETNVFTSRADFEEQCCAENGQPPDCFEPVSTAAE